MKTKLPLRHSLAWIFGSVLLVNGLFWGLLACVRNWKEHSALDNTLPIRAIVQTGPQREAVKTAYLAELLGLSIDAPVPTESFDLKLAKQKLLCSPIIKEAEVKIAEPGILYIDYSIRRPIALLLDYENIALDSDGYPFPLIPFFSPKNLPEIYLNMEEPLMWNQPLSGQKIALAFDLLTSLSGPVVGDVFNIQRIDVSHAFEPSLGKREIVLLTEDELVLHDEKVERRCLFPRILRLSTKKYLQELNHYIKLRAELLEKEKAEYLFPDSTETLVYAPEKVIDFRIERLAFIEEVE